MPDANPVAAQEMLSTKPPHFRYPKGSLQQMGPRRLPGASKGKCGSHRPPARFIEDNIVLCGYRLRRCHADCFPPSPAARGPRRVAVIAPACRHPGTPVARCRRGVKYGVAKPQAPTQPRMLAPFHPQGVCAKTAR